MRIAFVHDYLNQYGGAERVLQLLCSIFPRAPIYTAIYDSLATGDVFGDRVIRTSFLQKMPLSRRYHHFFSLLMPLAVEQLDVSGFNTVFSISSSFAKGIITKPNTRHICYCLTPPRFLWDDSQKYVQDFKLPGFMKKLVPPFLTYLRIWDRQAAQRPDELIAISNFVKNRIKKYYGRDAQVIYPPVNVAKFSINLQSPDNYFLMVGRLVAYKKFDLAIKVFNDLGWPLKIVGEGVELKYLKNLAKSNIEFLGLVGDANLADLYANARALIFPQEEDFGIVPLESMASGRPVIAYRGGGAIETITNETGLFFDEQTEESLKEALLKFDNFQFNPLACRAQAEKFDIKIFKDKILAKLA